MSRKPVKSIGICLLCLINFVIIGYLENIQAEEIEKTNIEEEKEKETTPIGLEGDELEEVEKDYIPQIKRLIIPPFYREKTEKYELKLLFPFYVQRKTEKNGGEKNLGILPFYWRHRSKELKTDVIFPFYSRMHGQDYKTDIFIQTYINRFDKGYNFGFAPLVFGGKNTEKQSSYQVVPPLFWRFVKRDESFTLAGIFYNRTKGDDYHLGLPPLFFAGKEKSKSYLTVLPPIFWRFTDEIEYSTKTVIPPFFFNTRENGWSFGAMPILYLARDKEWDRTLILPFYYGSRWQKKDKQGETVGEGYSHVLPLLLSYYRHAPGLSQGGAAIFYQWYWNEGDYLKMITPLAWLWGNDRRYDSSFLLAPFVYRRKSPIRNDFMISLIYWNFHEYHKERTLAIAPLFVHNWSLYDKRWRTWVFPTFDFGRKNREEFHARLHPLFYLGKAKEKSHLVVSPIYWQFRDKEDDDLVVFPIYWRFRDLLHEDTSRIVFPFWWQFEDPRRKNHSKIVFPLYWDLVRGKNNSRITLGLPIFWRYKDLNKTTTGVLNIFVNSGKQKGFDFWTFSIFPLISFGHPPSKEGVYWSFLQGMVGWRRQGRSKQLKMFWVPINF